MSDFARTLETAASADATAKMLTRVADGRGAIHALDVERLRALAARYSEYAAALRETVATAPAGPDPEQAVLL